MSLAQENSQKTTLEQPIVVNGDTVEYLTEKSEVTASGNVVVDYKGTILTCSKLTVNTQTKEGVAEGNARIEDKGTVIEGDKITYNFNTKSGSIVKGKFLSNPYFGKAEKIIRVNESEMDTYNGYATTCDYDHPHFRIGSKKIKFFPQDKIQTQGDKFYLGNTPLMYLSRLNRSLKDSNLHFQAMPGKRKDWGPYILSSWKYNIIDGVNGKIYFDYRVNWGNAQGLGLNYDTRVMGKGDFKFYYTQERDKNLQKGLQPRKFQRYMVRERHKWDIDESTNLIAEYYKIVDSKRALLGSENNFLKDYFYREYEKDAQPLTYVQIHRSLNNSTADILFQPRVNNWYDEIEKLPQISYSLPNIQIGQTPFYIENISQMANFNHEFPAPSEPDIKLFRFDTFNKISMPMRIAFFRVTPFVGNRETYYNKDVNSESINPRTIFYSGSDVSTKFYRIFDVNTNFLKLDINQLRHIITPTFAYSFNHEPTILSSRLKQFDSLDSIARSNTAALELSNKLQTKRNNSVVDLVDFRINTNYNFKPKVTNSTDRHGSSFSDIVFNLDLIPYSWMRIVADATYKHSGLRTDSNYHRFTNANYDINFSWGPDRSFAIGERYVRKGSNEIIYSLNYRISPKWKFSVYERVEASHSSSLKRGFREQEYTISRDLHCWKMDLTYNVKRDFGESIYLIFTLKAFPDLQFNFNQSYHAPKGGSSTNP